MDELDLLELAWALIANVDGGDWLEQTPEWRGAARRFRDGWHEILHKLVQARRERTRPPPEWLYALLKEKSNG
jgi:hypothetical protein